MTTVSGAAAAHGAVDIFPMHICHNHANYPFLLRQIKIFIWGSYFSKAVFFRIKALESANYVS